MCTSMPWRRHAANTARSDARLDRRRHNSVDFGQILVVDYRIDGEICLHPIRVAAGSDLPQIFKSEVGAGARTHIQAFDSEVYGVGTCGNSCCQGFVAPHGSHDFKVAAFHFHKHNKSYPATLRAQDMTVKFSDSISSVLQPELLRELRQEFPQESQPEREQPESRTVRREQQRQQEPR